jgi:hypothetical protein
MQSGDEAQSSRTVVAHRRARDASHPRPSGPASERGMSLALALAFLAGLGIVVAAMLTYAQATTRSTDAFRQQRAARYQADSVIEDAIHWASSQPKTVIDPNSASVQNCHMRTQTVANGGVLPVVDVYCAADAGSGSGLPKDPGLVPDQAILTLGQRDHEVRPFSGSSCITETGKKGYDNLLGASILGTNRTEFGIRFSKTSFLCISTRSVNQWQVKGKVISNSPIVANGGGGISLVGTGSSIRARGGCTNVASCTDIGRVNADPMDPASVMTEGHDPRTNQCDSTGRPDGYTRAQYCASWNLPDISALPLRSVPAVSQCGAGKVVTFEPGYYNDIGALNSLFKNGACKATTFWFSPGRGTDGQLLGTNYQQGLYYFDFTNGSGGGCNWYSSSSSTNHQWCIGNSNDSNQVVVGGTPKGWSPFGAGTGSVALPPMTSASIDGLNTSPIWGSQGNATSINGSSASYSNPILAINRNITLKDFSPKLPSGVFSGGVTIRVAHNESNSFNTPQVTVRYDSTTLGSKSCGTFNLNKGNYTQGNKDSITGAAATQIANCMNHRLDALNGIKITYSVGGCNFLCGGGTITLDGIEVEAGAFPNQPSFPRPPSTSDSGGDCDETKPGVQFIFGGDSHVYVADGSLELCAGPPAVNIDRQEIALYGVPGVMPVRSTGSRHTAQSDDSGSTFGELNIKRIAEPDSGRGDYGDYAGISYSTGNCGFCSKTIRGGIDLDFSAFSLAAYPNLQVKQVVARISYDTEGLFTGSQLVVPCSSGSQTINLSPSMEWFQVFGAPEGAKFKQTQVDVTSCMKNRITSSNFGVTYFARSQVICGFWICGSRSFTDKLDGVEFIVELEKASSVPATTIVPVPQNGCTYWGVPGINGSGGAPNYWNAEQGGEPQCALIKADQTKNNPFTPDSRGRFSIKGTIYAPTGAVDIDDEDVLYPFFNRGLVARTLMLRGFRYRIPVPIADVPVLDRSQAAREGTFTACVRGASNTASTGICDTTKGDRILARARVRFEIQTNWVDPACGGDTMCSARTRARVPKVQWWSSDR